MINLNDHKEAIISFLGHESNLFKEKHPQYTSPHVALYSCAWSGWVSLCLNPEPQLEQNCPDFKFVEFGLYEAPDWATEYENHERLEIVDLNNATQVVESEIEGDEGFNRVVFNFLESILASEEAAQVLERVGLRPSRLGVQMLDSAYEKSWKPIL